MDDGRDALRAVGAGLVIGLLILALALGVGTAGLAIAASLTVSCLLLTRRAFDPPIPVPESRLHRSRSARAPPVLA